MKRNLIFGTLVVLVLALCPANAQNGQVSGTILGDDGKPLIGAKVVYSDPNNGRKFNFKTDKKGHYVAIGIPYGSYNVTITNDKGEQVVNNASVSVGVDPEDNDLQLDLSKPDSQQRGHISHSGTGGPGGPAVGGHTLPSTQGTDQPSNKSKGGGQGQTQAQNQGGGQISPGGQSGESGQQPKYTKQQVEEIKNQRAKAEGANALIKQVNEAMTAKNWQAAIPPLQQLITGDPNNWQYYSGLGDAQYNLEQYDQAVETYNKGIQVADSSNAEADAKDPSKKKAGVAKMLTNEGNSYLKLHKNKEAVDAYTKAASMDPSPGTAFFNLCATQYNTGNVDGAMDACDKAIAADPTKADAYFIKGSLLIAGSKTDSSGKVTAPPGTAEALNKYLELQPGGSHAADVKQMLEYIGSKVETTYKKRGK